MAIIPNAKEVYGRFGQAAQVPASHTHAPYTLTSLPAQLSALFSLLLDSLRLSSPLYLIFLWFCSIREDDLDAWYKVSNYDVLRHGGVGLLSNFNNSLPALLAGVYPDHPWQFWRFDKVNKAHLPFDAILKDLEEKFEITKPEDWSRISAKQVRDLGLESFLAKHGGLSGVLRKAYPDLNDASLLKRSQALNRTPPSEPQNDNSEG